MEKVRFVGLDVHADSIVIAVAEQGRGDAEVLATIPNDTRKLLKRLRGLGKIKCCYGAGPTGYGLYRALTAEGIDCVVVAPSLVPRKGGERVKTDRRDALRLARFLRSGDLTGSDPRPGAGAGRRQARGARRSPAAREVPPPSRAALPGPDHLDEESPAVDPRTDLRASRAPRRTPRLPQDRRGPHGAGEAPHRPHRGARRELAPRAGREGAPGDARHQPHLGGHGCSGGLRRSSPPSRASWPASSGPLLAARRRSQRDVTVLGR